HLPYPSLVYTLSLHDALPILSLNRMDGGDLLPGNHCQYTLDVPAHACPGRGGIYGGCLVLCPENPQVFSYDMAFLHHHLKHTARSEEHTSELQSRFDLVWRLL